MKYFFLDKQDRLKFLVSNLEIIFKCGLGQFQRIWRLIKAYIFEHEDSLGKRKPMDEIEYSLLETMFGDAYIEEKLTPQPYKMSENQFKLAMSEICKVRNIDFLEK